MLEAGDSHRSPITAKPLAGTIPSGVKGELLEAVQDMAGTPGGLGAIGGAIGLKPDFHPVRSVEITLDH